MSDSGAVRLRAGQPGCVTRVVKQSDASAHNRAYYERADVRRDYRPDSGLDAAETALVERFLPAGASVLDLGCGNGRAALALAGRGYRVEGLDISPSMIEEARAAADALGVDVRFRIGDAVALPHDENELDAVVFACNGLGHLTREGKVACLLELRRVLKPGGVALLSLRTPYALNRMLPRLLRNVVVPRKGLRPDEERDDDQYVQRPPLSWLVNRCREARLDPVCVCSHRQAAAGAFPRRTAPLGGEFYVVATA
jgi:SAM-dependent methyltransferase